jgi:hypothetical protein
MKETSSGYTKDFPLSPLVTLKCKLGPNVINNDQLGIVECTTHSKSIGLVEIHPVIMKYLLSPTFGIGQITQETVLLQKLGLHNLMKITILYWTWFLLSPLMFVSWLYKNVQSCQRRKVILMWSTWWRQNILVGLMFSVKLKNGQTSAASNHWYTYYHSINKKHIALASLGVYIWPKIVNMQYLSSNRICVVQHPWPL